MATDHDLARAVCVKCSQPGLYRIWGPFPMPTYCWDHLPKHSGSSYVFKRVSPDYTQSWWMFDGELTHCTGGSPYV